MHVQAQTHAEAPRLNGRWTCDRGDNSNRPGAGGPKSLIQPPQHTGPGFPDRCYAPPQGSDQCPCKCRWMVVRTFPRTSALYCSTAHHRYSVTHKWSGGICAMMCDIQAGRIVVGRSTANDSHFSVFLALRALQSRTTFSALMMEDFLTNNIMTSSATKGPNSKAPAPSTLPRLPILQQPRPLALHP